MKKLYIYSDHNRYEYRIEHGDAPFLKIGETLQEVEDRVSQQDGTSQSEPLEIKYVTELPDNVTDHDIHRFFDSKNIPVTRTDKKREFYEITLKDAVLLINEYLYGSKRPDSYAMRDEQQIAHDKMVSYFKSHSDEPKSEFLLAAKMRFGKNFTLLNVARTLMCKNILVLTYKPWVFNSLENDIKNHVYFENYNYIELFHDRNLSALDKEKTNVIVASAQLSLNETKSYEYNEDKQMGNLISAIRNNLETLKQYHFDLVVVDEYHYGSSTANFKSLLRELDYQRLVYVSGTAMRDIRSHRFDDEQIFNWTYIDEQQKVGNDMPKMRLFALSLDESIIAEAKKYYTEDEYPKMEKLFEVNEDGEFVHKNLVNMTLAQILGKSSQHRKASPFLIDNIETPKHVFCLMPPNVKAISALSKLIERDYSDRFCVIKASGSDGIRKESQLLKLINKAKADRKSTITLSCIRFREGVTIPDWDSVLMLDDGKSVVSYFQAIFRCQSQRKEKPLKRECYVFDYNPQRMLMLTYMMTEIQSLTSNESHIDTVSHFLDCAPMVGYDAQNRLYPVDLNHLLSVFFSGNKAVNNGFRSFDKDRNFNDDVLAVIDKAYIGLLPSIKSGKARPTLEIVSSSGLEGGKTRKGRKVQKTGEKPEATELQKLKESLRYVSSRLPEYMFNTIEDEFRLQDILDTKSDTSYTFFRDLCLTDLDVFKELINDGILDKRLMNRLISNYKMEENHFWQERTPDGYDYMSKKYFIDDENDVKTPIELARLMLDKLPEEVWHKKDYTFCDMACKDPSFLLVIKFRLMKGLRDVIPDESERERHILQNMLYGLCRTQTQQNFVRRTLHMEKCGEHIIYCNNDILEYLNTHTDMPKFDTVVMNPPYKDTLHLKFLEQGFKEAKRKLLTIQPCNWIIKQMDTGYRGGNSERAVIENFEEYGATIDLVKGAQFFSAGFLAELSINYVDKDIPKDKRKITVIGDLSESPTTYSKVGDITKYGDDPLILSMKKKIVDYIEAHQNGDIYSHLRATPRMKGHCVISLLEYNPKRKWQCVNFSAIRGHVNQETGEKEADFYTLVPKDLKPKQYSEELAYYVHFDKKVEAKNMINYLKTDFVRFALFLTKNDANTVNCLRLIPWMDYSKELDDKMLFEEFGFIEKEIERIYQLIPDYYGIRK